MKASEVALRGLVVAGGDTHQAFNLLIRRSTVFLSL
jgi:hypothetical protein